MVMSAFYPEKQSRFLIKKLLTKEYKNGNTIHLVEIILRSAVLHEKILIIQAT